MSTIIQETSLSGTINPSTSLSGTVTPSTSLSGSVGIPEFVGVETPATRSTLGLVIVGDNLSITTAGVLSVDTANEAQQDNTKPITSAAVNTIVGNVNALLATI